MKTLKFNFKSEGKTITRTAILTDDLQELSRNKKNQCSDITDFGNEDGYWSLIFEGENGENVSYEIEMEYDTYNFERTLVPIKAITWDDSDSGVIIDEQEVTLSL